MQLQNPEISLTDFADFIFKSGTTRLTHVKNLKARRNYHPASDYWRQLRENIIEEHPTSSDVDDWSYKLLANLQNPQKRENYLKATMGFSRFLKNRDVEYFKSSRIVWSYAGLTIRLNPEVGMAFDGSRYHTKFYFKADQIRKSQANVVLYLLHHGLFSHIQDGNFALIDIQRGKPYFYDAKEPSLLPLIKAEARAFFEIWSNLP